MLPPPSAPNGGDIMSAAIGVNLPTATAVMESLLATTQAATALFTAVATATSSPDDSDGAPGECRLIGPFALIIQGALGALALLSLVFKRWRERPQRPLKIWFFDVSKQVFGSVLVHIANIFMSMLTSGRLNLAIEQTSVSKLVTKDDDTYVPNPCSFYLLNLAIDTTVGIPILIILLRLTTGLIALTPWGKPVESIQSGHYGHPPKAWWWFKQSVIYFFGLFGMKVCVLVIFLLMPWISKVGDWALGWTDGNERLQIAFVMMIFPLIMNGLQYYIIDSFIMKSEASHELIPSEDPDAPRRYDDNADDGEVGDNDSSTIIHDESIVSGRPQNDSECTGREQVKLKNRVETQTQEYDPSVDGEAPTVVAGTSRPTTTEPPPELFPKE